MSEQLTFDQIRCKVDRLDSTKSAQVRQLARLPLPLGAPGDREHSGWHFAVTDDGMRRICDFAAQVLREELAATEAEIEAIQARFNGDAV